MLDIDSGPQWGRLSFTSIKPSLRMHPLDPLRFLLGNRDAILRLAGSSWAWLIGALLVVTAGLARNYDHLSLLKEGEWIYGPFAMSLFSAALIYGFLQLMLSIPAAKGNFRTFLSFFWLTAPCAWLYGIPVERWMSLLDATKWNVAFLLIVSIWRICLMARAVSVLSNTSFFLSLLIIVVPASAEMGIGSFFQRLSLIGAMSGSRLPSHNDWLVQTTHIVMLTSVWCFLLAVVVWGIYHEKRFPKTAADTSTGLAKARIGSGWKIWLLPGLALLGWAGIALPEQPVVNRTYQLKQLIHAERYREAIDYAAHFKEQDFSQIQEFPPGSYPSYIGQRLVRLLVELKPDDPTWLRKVWQEEFVVFALVADPGNLSQILSEDVAILRKSPGLLQQLEAAAAPLRLDPSQLRSGPRLLEEIDHFIGDKS